MGGATAGLAVFYYSDGKWWPARSIIDPPTRQITGLDIPVTEYVALTTLAGRVDVSLEGLGVLGMGADEAEMVTVRGSVGGVARVSGYEELGTPEGLRSFSQVGGSGVVPEVSGWGAAGVLGVVGLLGRRRRR
jgi:MYXO-CTERM domain-containing protein